VPPCERRNIKLSSSPSKPGAPGESATYLKLEKSRFLFLEGSGGAATAPVVAAAAALTSAPSARAAPPLTARGRAPAPLPPLRPLVTGVGDSTSQPGPAPRRSPLPPPPTNSLESLGGEPLILTQPVLLTLLLPALPPPDPPLLCARCPLLFSPLRGTGGCPCPGFRWIRSCGVHGHPLLKDNYQDRTSAS
jgi:hypothetical protein